MAQISMPLNTEECLTLENISPLLTFFPNESVAAFYLSPRYASANHALYDYSYRIICREQEHVYESRMEYEASALDRPDDVKEVTANKTQ